jgi:hypothetical protein
MTRTDYTIYHPYYSKPSTPPPEALRPLVIRNPDGLSVDRSLVANLNDWGMIEPLDESSYIMSPYSYDYGPDQRSLRLCWDSPDTLIMFRTCIAYEQIGKDHPRILRYLRRDPWTGFPNTGKIDRTSPYAIYSEPLFKNVSLRIER